MRKRLLRGLFEEGADVARATRLLAENPVNGDPGVRGWWFAEEIAEADELSQKWREITAGWTPAKIPLTVSFPGRHVRRLTGEIRSFSGPDGSSSQLVLADSNRAEKEALLTHVFLSAAGAGTALGVLKKDKDDGVVFVRYRPMESDEAAEVLRQCVRLFDESFDHPVIWPDSFEDGVFWRGLDIKKARELRKRVEDEIKALLQLLAEVTEAPSGGASESSEEAKAPVKPKKGGAGKKASKKKEPESTPEERREKSLTSLAENVEALVARNY